MLNGDRCVPITDRAIGGLGTLRNILRRTWLAQVRPRLLREIFGDCHHVVALKARGDRLHDLVTQRCSQFSHHAHAVDAREIFFQLAQSFALLVGALAVRDVVVGLQGCNRRTPYISSQ